MQNTDILSRFSHEMRNSLTLIHSSLQLLEKECPAVLESALWPQIRQDVSELIQTLREKTFSAETLHRTVFTAEELLSDVSASCAPAMELHGITFVTVPPASRIQLTADRARLSASVTNLLINAADAVSENSGPKEITLSAAMDGGDLCIHVRDNGPGIPEDRLGSLFEPFVTYKPHGSGLGLAIVRKTACQHGGRVTVETDTRSPGSYTDFCLRLPLA